ISRIQMQNAECRAERAEGPSALCTLHSAFCISESLCTYAEGLHLLVDEPGLAEQLRDAFGDRLWLEIIRPRPEGQRHEEALLAAGRRLGLRPVASSAAHFCDAAEYPAFRLITAVRRNTLLDRLPGVLQVTLEHRLLSADEMRRRFADLPEAVRNGDELAG